MRVASTSRRRRKLLRYFLALCVFGSALYLSLSFLVVTYFGLPEIIVIHGRAGRKHKAFSELAGFVDVSITLKASDWPWTFSRPAILGELYSEGPYLVRSVNWSGDGSVLALSGK